jgi:Saxitoxin biosynthesis operon protein SxtJ
MMNPFAEVNWNPDRAARRKFGLSLMIGFPCIATVLLLGGHFARGSWKPGLVWLGVVGFALGLVFWVLPGIAKPFYLVWYFLGCCMGFVIGNLVLSAFFYGLMTPVGWLMRATARRPLAKGFDRTKTTYWEDAEKGDAVNRYYQQF